MFKIESFKIGEVRNEHKLPVFGHKDDQYESFKIGGKPTITEKDLDYSPIWESWEKNKKSRD